MSDPLILLQRGKPGRDLSLRQEQRGKSRFSMEYKPGTLMFWNADAKEIAGTMSDLLFNEMKRNFLDSRDAAGKKRKRKGHRAKKRYWQNKNAREIKTEKLKAIQSKKINKKYIVEKYDIPKQWVKQTWKGLKAIEKKMLKSQKEELKNYKMRGAGIKYPDRYSQEGVIWSGLMFESLKQNAPRAARKKRDENGNRYWTRGRVRISTSSKRRVAVNKWGFFKFGTNSPTHRKVEEFSHLMMRKAVTRYNYNQRARLAKFAGRLIWKAIRGIYGI